MILYFLQLENVHSHVERYFEKFCNLLGPGNRRYIQTLMVLTRAFLRVLLHEKDAYLIDSCQDTEKTFEESRASEFTMSINNFMFELNVDNINLVKLVKYLKESKIMHKVNLATEYLHYLQKKCYTMLRFLLFLSFRHQNALAFPG